LNDAGKFVTFKVARYCFDNFPDFMWDNPGRWSDVAGFVVAHIADEVAHERNFPEIFNALFFSDTGRQEQVRVLFPHHNLNIYPGRVYQAILCVWANPGMKSPG